MVRIKGNAEKNRLKKLIYLGFQISNPVLWYRPGPSCMTNIGARAEVPWEHYRHTLGPSGNQTWTAGLKAQRASHLTTGTAHLKMFLFIYKNCGVNWLGVTIQHISVLNISTSYGATITFVIHILCHKLHVIQIISKSHLLFLNLYTLSIKFYLALIFCSLLFLALVIFYSYLDEDRWSEFSF